MGLISRVASRTYREKSPAQTTMPISYTDIAIDDGDIPFEEDIVRNPYNVKSWLRFIDHKSAEVKNTKPRKFQLNVPHTDLVKTPLMRPERQLNMIFERAVK